MTPMRRFYHGIERLPAVHNAGVAIHVCKNLFATENTETAEKKSQILCDLCGFTHPNSHYPQMPPPPVQLHVPLHQHEPGSPSQLYSPQAPALDTQSIRVSLTLAQSQVFDSILNSPHHVEPEQLCALARSLPATRRSATATTITESARLILPPLSTLQAQVSYRGSSTYPPRPLLCCRVSLP